ncbi:MAG: hypothetical protein ACLP7A_02260 [Desulfobaccales bacterium]
MSPKSGRTKRSEKGLLTYTPGAKAHRWVLSESGLWSLGCDCFAF